MGNNKKMGVNANIMNAYVKMLLDGTAFFGSNKKPNKFQRQRLVENIYYNFPQLINSPSFESKIKKVVKEANNEIEFNEMLSDMLIKEDEFLVK